jgi:hypothetical protein
MRAISQRGNLTVFSDCEFLPEASVLEVVERPSFRDVVATWAVEVKQSTKLVGIKNNRTRPKLDFCRFQGSRSPTEIVK